MTYRLLIDLTALELLMGLPPARRRRFIAQFHRLQDFPSVNSDFRDTDKQGRLVQVSIFDGFAIYFWIDEADQHVKILEIIPADSRDPG